MRNISVSAFINTLFTLVLTLLVSTLFLFISWDKEKQKVEELNRYKLISNFLLSTAQLSPSSEEKKEFYTNSDIKPVSMNESRLILLSKREVVFEGKSVYGRMQIFAIGKNRYIYVQRYGFSMMLKDYVFRLPSLLPH